MVEVRTQVRHTTVIVLPVTETILDFVVGDSEYWHLTGAANVAYLKPVRSGVSTNVALVSASGRIFSLLGAIKQRYQIRHRNRPELRGYQALRSRAGSRSGAPGSNIGIRSFR